MEQENLLNPPEPNVLPGTKRLSTSAAFGRPQTKRLCTQLGDLATSAGNAVLESTNGYNSREWSSAAFDPRFSSGALQQSIDIKTDWSNAALGYTLDGLGSTFNPPVPESGPLLFAPMPDELSESNSKGYSGADRTYYEIGNQGSTNIFNTCYSFDENSAIAPNFNTSYVSNIGFASNLDESRTLPDPIYSSWTDRPTDNTSTWVDVTTTSSGKSSGSQPSRLSAPQPLETFGVVPKWEETVIDSVNGVEVEVEVEADEEISGGSRKPSKHKKDLSEFQPSSPEREQKSIVLDLNQIDICLGVIIAQTTSSWTGTQGMNETPVTLSPFGDIMKMSFQDSMKYAGILTLPALCEVPKRFNIDYDANMVATGSRKDQQTAPRKLGKLGSAHACSVRIVVYGLKSDADSVGSLFSDAGLYLQHPSAAELNRGVDYWNPHYLLRPGSQMPNLEFLSLSASSNSVATSTSLEETHKSRFLQLFNSASGPSNLMSPTPSPRLKSTLEDHQLTALTMMMEKECGVVENAQFPSLWGLSTNFKSALQYRHKVTGTCKSIPVPVYGGVLADEMGLGKTLSLLALVCSSLDSVADQENSPDDGMSRATLIITPMSTVPVWQQQVESHIFPGQLRLALYHGSNRHLLPANFWKNDIILTTYETLRSDCAANGPLYSGTWRRVVLDEAHHIRNRSSQLFKAAIAVASKSRWCLTGTPIHNSLDDYGALLSFIRTPLLMEKSQFDLWITSPIKQERPNSFNILEDLVRATCLRRTKDATKSSLKIPRKIERTEGIELHEADLALYEFFREKTAKIAAGLAGQDGGKSKTSTRTNKGANILALINFLRLICNSGKDLLPKSALEAWRSRNSALVDWQMLRNCSKVCAYCESNIEETDSLSDGSPEFNCHHSICAVCSAQNENTSTDEVLKCPKCTASRATSRNSTEPPELHTRLSAKIEALIRNLGAEQMVEHSGGRSFPTKSVIFSQWTKMLDLIAKALTQHHFRFQRIDGRSSLKQRKDALQQFNQDPTCTVMLASIGSAGEGVDLTAANHVHLVEPHWSPMAEAQAIDRIHRMGQTREVTITKYIATNTIETYIQWVQRDKLRLISKSLDSSEVLQADLDNARWRMLQTALDVSN